MDAMVEKATILDAKAEFPLYLSAKIAVFAAAGMAAVVTQVPNNIVSVIPNIFIAISTRRGNIISLMAVT